MVIQKWNDQKVVNCTHAKTQHEWDKLLIITKKCPPLPKSTLVKFALKQLLQVLGFNVWGVGSVFQDATSKMEKYEDLQEMIQSIRSAYAQ